MLLEAPRWVVGRLCEKPQQSSRLQTMPSVHSVDGFRPARMEKGCSRAPSRPSLTAKARSVAGCPAAAVRLEHECRSRSAIGRGGSTAGTALGEPWDGRDSSAQDSTDEGHAGETERVPDGDDETVPGKLSQLCDHSAAATAGRSGRDSGRWEWRDGDKLGDIPFPRDQIDERIMVQ